MPRKKEDYSIRDLSSLMTEGLTRAVTRPSVHGYTPHEKQIKFHTSPARGRLYIGGNRSGKTVGGIVEDIFWLRGQHPYHKIPTPPVKGRIVTTSLEEGIKKIIIPELTRWIPPSDLINGSWEDSYEKASRTLNLSNGSFVELMTYEQDVDKFAGTSRHFIHYDEEPPKPIFDECKMRLMDLEGSWWMTMTPLLGMTWVYTDIYQPGLVPGSDISVIEIDVHENPYISDAEIDSTFSDMSDDDKKMRMEGKFVQVGGLVFKTFDPVIHVVPELNSDQLDRIKLWTHYASLDHGYNNQTAWLWHGVSPDNNVITYDQIYDREKIVKYYAKIIHERNQLPHRRAPDIYVGDPSIEQRNAQTGDSIRIAYVREGIPIVLGNNDVKIGVEKMNAYFKLRKWVITENCADLIRELKLVRWKTYNSAKQIHDNNRREEIHKKDDHSPDSCRYFFSMMPDLHIPKDFSPPTKRLTVNDFVQNATQAVTVPVGPGYYDTNLQKQETGTEWTVVDEHLGGFF